jgi:hypothetical protein
MRRILVLGLLAGLVLLALPAGGAAAQATPDDPTGTTAPAAAEGGTSPWVLVLIGAAAGAVAGVFTGLSRRRRAQRRDGG